MSFNPITKGATHLWSTYNSKPAVDSPNFSSLNTLVLASFVFAGVILAVFNVRRSDKNVPYKRGTPLIGSWSFFTHRYSFLKEGLTTLGGTFWFKILHHKVLVVSGQEARKVFFGSKDLSVREGYRVLQGGVPDIEAIGRSGNHLSAGDVVWFGKRIVSVLKKDQLSFMIPLLIADVDTAMSGWSTRGKFDPFDRIYNAVFQLTIRAGSCHEIANSPSLVSRVRELYWHIERGSTATTVLLPWLPSKARKLKNDATKELYDIVKGVVDERQRTGRKEVDAMQVLLDEGDGVNDVVQFILVTLFAGIANTGIMASWILLYLHKSPSWKSKATAEIRSFISQYASPSSNLVTQLSAIPPEIWDEQMPVLDVCLRETIRTVFSMAALRRVMNDEGVIVDGVKVEKGGFLVYQMTDAHLDEVVYSDPGRWDPGRYERGEDKKEQWAFLGWGVGRHPCLGMRFAKLEVKIILAMFLTRYEYSLVDAQGKNLETLPEPYRDNLFKVPPSAPVYVKYERRDAA